jgi:hypothetical protein
MEASAGGHKWTQMNTKGGVWRMRLVGEGATGMGVFSALRCHARLGGERLQEPDEGEAPPEVPTPYWGSGAVFAGKSGVLVIGGRGPADVRKSTCWGGRYLFRERRRVIASSSAIS